MLQRWRDAADVGIAGSSANHRSAAPNSKQLSASQETTLLNTDQGPLPDGTAVRKASAVVPNTAQSDTRQGVEAGSSAEQPVSSSRASASAKGGTLIVAPLIVVKQVWANELSNKVCMTDTFDISIAMLQVILHGMDCVPCQRQRQQQRCHHCCHSPTHAD